MRLWFLALCLLFSACVSHGNLAVPDTLTDIPWSGVAGDQAVLEARRLYDLGQGGAAMAMLDMALIDHPRHVDGHRLRQDLLRAQGRVARVRSEAQARLKSWGGDPRALYLYGRIAKGSEDKLAAFREVTATDPALFWGWLGLAYSLRTESLEQSLTVYRGLYEASGQHPIAARGYASVLRADKQYDKALQIYQALRTDQTLRGVGDIGMAETYLASGRNREAWRHIMLALEFRGYDPGVRQLIAQVLTKGMPPSEQSRVLDILKERPERLRQFANSGGQRILSTLLERSGDIPGAIDTLQAVPDPKHYGVARRLRRLRLASGDLRGYLRDFEAAMPQALIRDERNQVRSRWLALFEGPWATSGTLSDPLSRLDWSLQVVQALSATGQLLEAEMTATLALQRHPDADLRQRDALRKARDEARKEQAFEHAMRRVLYLGYTREDPEDLQVVLGHLRRISLEIFDVDVVGQPEFFQIPMVGTMVDSVGPGLGTHLAKYNKHLVLGQRAGGAAEGLMLTILSKTDLKASAELPVATRCWRVVGEHREIQSLHGVLGGDLAGIALLNHYVIDFDAVRDWARTLRQRRDLAGRYGLLEDPIPAPDPSIEGDAMDPLDVHWRLSALSPLEDSQLLMSVLEMISWHERAHLVDSFHFLPPESNLWRVLGLLFSHGFSALAIEAEMEGKAEHAALCWSEHTELVLAHIASFLATEAPGSPHALGFRRLAEALQTAFAADPELVKYAAVRDWHQLPMHRVRQIARQLWHEIW